MEQLWECPKCGVIVKVSEVLPPLTLDAGEVIERKLLTLRVNGLDKILRRFRLGLPFLRLGCWLADMDLEMLETPEPAKPEVWRSQGQRDWSLPPNTVEELDRELQYRKYLQDEEHANRLADIGRWYAAERDRLAHIDRGEQVVDAEPVLGGPEGE